MTEGEEQDLLHKVDRADEDLTGLTSDVVQLKKDVAELKAGLAQANEEISKLVKMFSTLEEWVDTNRIGSMPRAKGRYNYFNQLLQELRENHPFQ